MITKSANLTALQYLMTEPEELMEKEATMAASKAIRVLTRGAGKKVPRQPQRFSINQKNPAAGAPQKPSAPKQLTQEEAYFNQYGRMPDMIRKSTTPHTTSGTVSGGTAPSSPSPQGPSFRNGMSQVRQGFSEMGSAIAQRGRNAINKGLQAGTNAVMNGGRNALSWIRENPGVAIGVGAYSLGQHGSRADN